MRDPIVATTVVRSGDAYFWRIVAIDERESRQIATSDEQYGSYDAAWRAGEYIRRELHEAEEIDTTTEETP